MGILLDREVYVVVGTPGEEGRQIAKLRIDFTVEQTKYAAPNKAKIQVYNLKRTTAALFERGDDRRAIQLFAGYDNGTAAALLFQGEIRSAKTIKNGVDRITRVEAADGGAEYRSARLVKSWAGPVSSGEIITALQDSFGTLIELPDEIPEIEFTSGFTAAGPSRETLSKLGASLGFDWTFEEGLIVVTATDGAVRQTAPVLSQTTGLVGSIEETDKGVSGTSLLNPEIRPKRFVNILTDQTEGFFLVQKVTHKGSNYDTSFYTEFEAREKPR